MDRISSESVASSSRLACIPVDRPPTLLPLSFIMPPVPAKRSNRARSRSGATPMPHMRPADPRHCARISRFSRGLVHSLASGRRTGLPEKPRKTDKSVQLGVVRVRLCASSRHHDRLLAQDHVSRFYDLILSCRSAGSFVLVSGAIQPHRRRRFHKYRIDLDRRGGIIHF